VAALSRTFATPLAVALGAGLAAVAWPAAAAGRTQAFTLPQQPYADSQARQYKVHVPTHLSGPAPMVLALHGCRQTHDDVLADWGLVAAAERHGFILVAPFVTRYTEQRNPNCWGFWLDAHRHQGRGEAEDLHQIALAVEARFPVDPQRRYVTGLSSGGAMAVVLAATHNEYFAAVASAAGLPYGEDAAAVSLTGNCPGSASFHTVARAVTDAQRERDDAYPIPLMVLQNQRDCTVLPAAATRLRDVQLKLVGPAAPDTPAEAQATQGDCAPVFGEGHGCQHTRYTVDGRAGSRSMVETVFYSGPLATPDPGDQDHGHYWIGGADGRDGPYAVQRGPVYPEIVLDFFARHPALARPAPAPLSCATARGAPGAHLAAGRAAASGWLGSSAVSNGDGADIGFAWDFFMTRVTLHEGHAGKWFLRRPGACPPG